MIWVHTDDPEPVEEHLRKHPLIAEITLLDRFEDRALYRIKWEEEPDSIFEELQSKRAALLDAVGIGESWTFELRFPTHEALAEFHTHCQDAGLPITLDRIYRPNNTDTTARYGMTDVQYDTLLEALEQGYFDIPRKVVTEELGEQLGISDQAVTEPVAG